MSTALLRADGITVRFGGLVAVNKVDLAMPAGEIRGLIGPNGAGKTTFFNAISGLVAQSEGTLHFDGHDITALTAHRRAAAGMRRTFQSVQLVPQLTVRENLELGALSAASRADIVPLTEDVFRRFPRLAERAEQRAASLSGGEQQMLAMGRALMSRPCLLLLDEPTTGLAPLIAAELVRIIRELNQAGLTILLVEQNLRMALQVADDVYVMRGGAIVLHEPAEAVRGREDMFASYLG